MVTNRATKLKDRVNARGGGRRKRQPTHLAGQQVTTRGARESLVDDLTEEPGIVRARVVSVPRSVEI